MRSALTFLAALVCSSAAERAAVLSRPSSHAGSLLPQQRLRGGAAPSDEMLQATFACNRLYASVLADASAEVAALRKAVAGGEAIPDFGTRADMLLTEAAEKFSSSNPKGDMAELYDAKAEELEAAVFMSLEPAFAQQIGLLKEGALEQFKKALVGGTDAAEAMVAAETAFARECKASVPSKSGWSTKAERASLSSILTAIMNQAKKATEAGAASQRQLQTAMNYLQLQSQQMQAMQQQYMAGQAGKWSFGGAYRPPDSNINLSGSYQQGRANIVMSMVPDEGAPLLGPNGFTQGVGPANLGLSLNVHI